MKKYILLIISSLLFSIAYSQFDTSGIHTWKKMYNSMNTWDEGAFNMYSQGHPDYGWGIYNMLDHNLKGDSLYAIKLQNNGWKNLYIQKKQSALNIYTFRYSDLDGKNLVVENIDNTKNSSKLFTYYSLSEKKIVDREPDNSLWDLVLTKYHDNNIDYNVTGILLNENVSASVFEAMDSTSAFTATLADTTIFSDSLTIIGNSWYRLKGMNIEPINKMAYFIKTKDNEIYRLNVTYFESGMSGQGRVGVRYQKLKPTIESAINDTLTMGSNYANDVYFKLSDGTKNSASRASWDIAFKSAIMSASIIANTTMGIELYTYPNIDAAEAWQINDINEKQLSVMQLFPNPVIDYLNIQSEDFTQGEWINIRIIDVLGREVFKRKSEVNGVIQLDLSVYSNGLYLIHIESGSKQSVGRFIKAN